MKKIALFLVVVVLSTNAWSDGDLRSAVQNPISSMISLPFKLNLDYGAENGDATILNIQPVIPVTVGDWNLSIAPSFPLLMLTAPYRDRITRVRSWVAAARVVLEISTTRCFSRP